MAIIAIINRFMANQTNPPPIPVSVPVTMSPEEIFDGIMGPIEPELTSGQVKLLIEKYKDELPDATRARKERYKRAYEEYNRRFAAWKKELSSAVRSFQLHAMRSVEEESRKNEEASLSHIEETLSSANS